DAIRWTVQSQWPMRAEPTRLTTIATATAGATIQGESFRVDGRAGWTSARAELELAPERLLLTALEAPDLRRTGASTVSFQYRDGDVTIELDPRSGLPARVTRRYADPADFY